MFCLRQKKAIQTLRKERAERLQNFRRTPSLSRQKQLSLLPSMDFPKWELNFPSRRRDYLQQLRKDIVETTRHGGTQNPVGSGLCGRGEMGWRF